MSPVAPSQTPAVPTSQWANGGTRFGVLNNAVELRSGFIRGLKNLECGGILFSEFKTLEVLEFPQLTLKSLEFVDVILSSTY